MRLGGGRTGTCLGGRKAGLFLYGKGKVFPSWHEWKEVSKRLMFVGTYGFSLIIFFPMAGKQASKQASEDEMES